MNRIDFMTGLNNLLADIPQAEREAAIQYYNDYFDDAGMENEEKVIRELENPGKVAEKIKEDLGIDKDAVLRYWQAQQRVQTESAAQGQPVPGQPVQGQPGQSQSVPGQSQNVGTDRVRKMTTGRIIAIICTAPLWIGLIYVLGALIVALGGMVFGFACASMAVLAAGILMIVWSMGKMMISPPAGMIVLGTGFLLIALAFGFFFAVYGLVKLIPLCGRAIGKFCRWLFGRGGRA